MSNNLFSAIELYKTNNSNKKTRFYYDDFLNLNQPVVLKYILQYFKDVGLIKSLHFNIKTNLFIFYSFKDLYYALGYNNVYPYLIAPRKGSKKGLSQTRVITGLLNINLIFNNNSYTFFLLIKDICGLGAGSLARLAKSVGLSKNAELDDYKTTMDLALVEKPYLFITYAINDALLLPRIYFLKTDNFNTILKSLNINVFYFKPYKLPNTIGTVVYLIWYYFIVEVVLENCKIKFLAFTKLGVLNKLHKNYVDNFLHFDKIQGFRSLQTFTTYCNENQTWLNEAYKALSQKNTFTYLPYQYASPYYLFQEKLNNAMGLLGLTSGGRTVNERPSECQIKYGADIDIQSAYGRALQKANYPLEKPRFYLSRLQGSVYTLRQFLNKYKNNLNPTLTKILVSGKTFF